MQVVSGPMGHEKIHYEAPAATKIENEIAAFLKWYESDNKIDPVLKAGIAHLWFEILHPFEDGNGRIGRAIIDMSLARAENTPDRFYSLSTQISLERKEYYRQLELQQKSSLDITYWLDWFLDCMGRALKNAMNILNHVLVKSNMWKYISENHSVSERQKKIINLMLEESFKGFMNTSKYAKLAKCSNDTALRDIQDLKQKNIFIKNTSGGRSTSYRLKEI